MDKVVPCLIPYNCIFYLNFFNQDKAGFLSNQIVFSLEIRLNQKSALLLTDRPSSLLSPVGPHLHMQPMHATPLLCLPRHPHATVPTAPGFLLRRVSPSLCAAPVSDPSPLSSMRRRPARPPLLLCPCGTTRTSPLSTLTPLPYPHTARPGTAAPGTCLPAAPPSSTSPRRVAATRRPAPHQLLTPCPFSLSCHWAAIKGASRRPSHFFAPSLSSMSTCHVLSSTAPSLDASRPPTVTEKLGTCWTPPLPPSSAIHGELGHTPLNPLELGRVSPSSSSPVLQEPDLTLSLTGAHRHQLPPLRRCLRSAPARCAAVWVSPASNLLAWRIHRLAVVL
jgi:hypothetical protein